MKAIKILTTLFVLGFIVGGSSFAQEKSLKEKQAEAEKKAREYEKNIQQIITENKILKEEELQQILESTKKLHEAEWQSQVESQNKVREEALRNFEMSRDNWRKYADGPVIVTSPDAIVDGNLPKNYFRMAGFFGMNDANTLNISKDLEDVTYSKDFPYEVAENIHTLAFSVSGEFDSGEMTVTIIKPDGVNLQEIPLSPLAKVSWNNNLTWKDENSKQFTGTWNVRVSAKGATGSYQILVRGK